ncbi:MAG TPA: acyl-CoA dehydrogenase family protein, partial [Bryobacteraceae bacterium]|nr:acyl-CoA dehydrogenase family protein [Bryobacteraceae bacterium]
MADCLTPENLTAEHLSIARTAQDFWTAEVAPNLAAIHRQDPGVLVSVLRKSAGLGFTAISIPERFGGMELDLASVMIVEECFARDASYLVTHGAQAGIGALPLIYFGTEEQKSKYLPKLADASMIAAYALTEPQAGTDAMAIRTRADLTPDGKHYILNGQKMWITNGGIADLYTVFAKVGGEKFTAFLVERAYHGVTPGAEEHKMGLHGSSTTALYLDNVAVPVENVLGEVGRGHIIAFN